MRIFFTNIGSSAINLVFYYINITTYICIDNGLQKYYTELWLIETLHTNIIFKSRTLSTFSTDSLEEIK